MKNIYLSLAGLLLASFLGAQIPNAGFEDWHMNGARLDPDDWATLNGFATGIAPVSRTTDHYPIGGGEYAIKIQNNLTANAYGIAMTTPDITMGPLPYFKIDTPPRSLKGYYKFLPQNGDTMEIVAFLYKEGQIVSIAPFIQSATVSSWTSFEVLFSEYETADSASIVMSAYYAEGPPPQYMPRGNSQLFVDNLSFSTGIGISEHATDLSGKIFPNPGSDKLNLSESLFTGPDLQITVYNSAGKELMKASVCKGDALDISEWQEGLYLIRIDGSESLYKIMKVQ